MISEETRKKLRDASSGIASGIAKVAVGHPFDTIKVRLQTEGQSGRFRGPIHALFVTVKTEGFRGLYKGCIPPFLGFGLTDLLMVGSYMRTRRFLMESGWHGGGATPAEPLSNTFVAGAIGGWTCTVIATPMELIKAKLQVQYADPATKRYSGSADCAKKLYQQYGIRGLYIGVVPTLMFRSFVSVYFGAYEGFKRAFQTLPLPTPAKNFLAGGCGATVMWIVAFPTDVVKNRIQAQSEIPSEKKYHGTIDCFKKIYAADGLKGFYRGFSPCLMRSFPANGAAFMAIELVAKYFPQ